MNDKEKNKEELKELEKLKLPEGSEEKENLPMVIPKGNKEMINDEQSFKRGIIKIFLVLWVLITIVCIGGGVFFVYKGIHFLGFLLISLFGVLNFLFMIDLLFNGEWFSDITFDFKKGYFNVKKNKSDEN